MGDEPYVEAMLTLQPIAGEREMLMVGDCKRISYSNMSMLIDAGVTFIAPLAAAEAADGLIAGFDPVAGWLRELVAARDGQASRSAAVYHVIEGQMTLNAPGKIKRLPRPALPRLGGRSCWPPPRRRPAPAAASATRRRR
ncbi:hypothetical protein [Nonomuraea fuscirosea]|uniref:hypothetical protein n=1 Tax=Nonomuraea fuscirosea TaxID=1291556 RepID=UPI0033D58EDD